MPGGSSRSRRWTHLAVATLVGGAALLARPARAQQYITDDAGITAPRACQIQMWHGQRASWVLPVCTPVRNLELSLGFIAVWDDDPGPRRSGHFEYVVQAKSLIRPLQRDGWGVGVVAGAGRDPALAGASPTVRSYYAYLPVSRSFAGDRVVLHQNTGWLYQRNGDEAQWRGRHAVSWAARADVAVGRARGGGAFPAVVLAEAYGAAGAAEVAPEFQVGVRAFPRPESVQVDLSWGGFARSGRRAAGWTLGLTLATPPFL